jgi:alpha-glucuronidase
MRSGRTLWEELVARYSRGVGEVAGMRRSWDALAQYVDRPRHAQIAAFLAIQEKEAQWWRDASIAYFQSVSRRPLPPGYAPPARDLDHYRSLQFPHAPGH